MAKTASLEEKEIREFIELKDYREDAAYSISVNYEKILAEDLGGKAIDFVNKTERIMSEEKSKVKQGALKQNHKK